MFVDFTKVEISSRRYLTWRKVSTPDGGLRYVFRLIISQGEGDLAGCWM